MQIFKEVKLCHFKKWQCLANIIPYCLLFLYYLFLKFIFFSHLSRALCIGSKTCAASSACLARLSIEAPSVCSRRRALELVNVSWEVDLGFWWSGALLIDSGLEWRAEFVGDLTTKLSTDLRCKIFFLRCAGMLGEVEPEDEFSTIKKRIIF